MRSRTTFSLGGLVILAIVALFLGHATGVIKADADDLGLRPANTELMFVTRGSLEGNIGVVG